MNIIYIYNFKAKNCTKPRPAKDMASENGSPVEWLFINYYGNYANYGNCSKSRPNSYPMLCSSVYQLFSGASSHPCAKHICRGPPAMNW